MLYILFGSFVFMCLIRVPVAFALFLSATLTIIFEGNVPLTVVTQRIWTGLNNFPLLAVPFFLFVGQLMNEAGISKRLIDFSDSLVGHLKGGLSHVNVVVSMIFAGISGASSADTAGVGSVLIPAMVNEGYGKGFTVGVTAASSTLGNIIPPSIMMIVYAASAGISVGAMFLTGVIPGILIGVGQMLLGYYYAKKHNIGGSRPFSWSSLWQTGKIAIFPLLIPFIIIGGIIGGIFTATEASVIAAVYSIILAFAYQRYSLSQFYRVMKRSIEQFSLSLFCVAAASLWGWVLAYYNIPQMVVASAERWGLLNSPLSVMGFVVLVFLAVGTFMDAVPAIIILQPIIGQIGKQVGIDPYHLGIVVVLTLAIGLVTPPYGLCLLIASDLAKITVADGFRALMPFIAISFAVVLIAVLLPDLMLWLPRLAMPEFIK
ncbi:MAG: TRAP transporter large permease [Limnochordia bacterium]|jgi:tripartite ATP-independent transporter DctM subunit